MIYVTAIKKRGSVKIQWSQRRTSIGLTLAIVVYCDALEYRLKDMRGEEFYGPSKVLYNVIFSFH